MLFDKLRQIEDRSQEIARRLADPAIFSQQAEYARLRKEHADSQEIVARFGEYRDVLRKLSEAQHILAEGGDRELLELAQAEIDELSGRQTALEADLKRLLLPRDPNDDKNVFVEIRAGAGGDEAALFAAELARMYTKYAERQRWKVEVMDSSVTGVGGLKDAILFIQGRGAWSRLKFERGVHRVQRVPVTGSPITASNSRCTGCPKCWKATSTSSSRRWPPPSRRSACRRWRADAGARDARGRSRRARRRPRDRAGGARSRH